MANIFKKIFKPKPKNKTFNEMVTMTGYEPNFSSFGQQINYSDIVLSALKLKARFFAKCDLRHIRTDESGKQIVLRDSNTAKALKNPNYYQITYDFLYQCYFMREIYDNCYIYKDTYKTNGGDIVVSGLYVLLPATKPRVVEDQNGGLKWAFTFKNYDYEIAFDFDEIICWKKDIEDNLYMGGGKYNSQANIDLLSSLEPYHQIKQSLAEAAKLGCMLDGIIKVNAYASDNEKTTQIRNKFVEDLRANKTGIAVLDNGADYQNVQRQLKMVDAATMKEIKENILIHTGVSIELLTSNYTTQQKEAFYESYIEPDATSFSQVMTKGLFSQWQQTHGDEITLYPHKVQLMATTEIISLIQSTVAAGIFKIDEYRDMLGYAPLDNGEGDQRPRGYNNLDGGNVGGENNEE